MKTNFQILEFLTGNPPASKSDLDIIRSFCAKQYGKQLPVSFLKLTPSPEGITSLQFADWYERGYGCGDWAIHGSDAVLIGHAHCDRSVICCTMDNTNVPDTKVIVLDNKELTHAPQERQDTWTVHLSAAGYELSPEGELVRKYIPSPLERTYLSNGPMEAVGAVQDITNAQVRFYCVYRYDTDTLDCSDNIVYDLNQWRFRPATIGEGRRLNAELSKCGKIWNDRMGRVEPIRAKAEPGQRYWYVNDKMNMASQIERLKPTSHFRYLAGNYFLNPKECLEVIGQFTEILKAKMKER